MWHKVASASNQHPHHHHSHTHHIHNEQKFQSVLLTRKCATSPIKKMPLKWIPQNLACERCSDPMNIFDNVRMLQCPESKKATIIIIMLELTHVSRPPHIERAECEIQYWKQFTIPECPQQLAGERVAKMGI